MTKRELLLLSGGRCSLKVTDAVLAAEVVERWVKPLELGGLLPPGGLDFELAAQFARSSAPGPDVLPYSAWCGAGRRGAVTLDKVNDAMLGGFGGLLGSLKV
jgi:hypothetical protein